MSLYRNLLAAVVAMGFTTCVFAAEEMNNTATQANPEASAPAAQAETNATAANEQSTTAEKVNVNTATAQDLMKVKGMNAAKAKAIITYRKKHGEFKSLDDLKEVKGFKKMNIKTMQSIQEQLTAG